MVVGVATRKYARSLEPVPDTIASRGTSKSAMRRRFVARTRAELETWAQRSVRELDLAALMVDGIGFGEHTLVVALGIDSSGTKHALAIREGSTENVSLCRSLLSDLVARGVPANRALRVVIDGGTGPRGAVKPVFGEYAVIQRCQVHDLKPAVIQRECVEPLRSRRCRRRCGAGVPRITAALAGASRPSVGGALRYSRARSASGPTPGLDSSSSPSCS